MSLSIGGNLTRPRVASTGFSSPRNPPLPSSVTHRSGASPVSSHGGSHVTQMPTSTRPGTKLAGTPSQPPPRSLVVAPSPSLGGGWTDSSDLSLSCRPSLRTGSPSPSRQPSAGPRQPGAPGPSRNGRWTLQPRAGSPVACQRRSPSPRGGCDDRSRYVSSTPEPATARTVPCVSVELESPNLASHVPEKKLAESKVGQVGDEPKFVEAVCNSLVAVMNAGETQEVQEQIAGIKKGIASLANRCEEILDLVKEMARDLDTERKGRHDAIDEVREQTRRHYEDLEHAILSQRDENSCRLEHELESVRVAAEAAMGEISSVKDHMLMSHSKIDAHGSSQGIDSLVGVLHEERERERRSAATHLQRSWEEEAANIRAHIKRFQDTFSKSLSLERESRQRDMQMLLGTMDERHRQATCEAGSEDNRQKPSRIVLEPKEPKDSIPSIGGEIVTLQ